MPARRHAQAVAGVDEGVGGSGPDTAGAAGGQHRRLGFQDVDLAGFHFERGHAQHVAGVVAQQVQRHPLDEELGAGGDVALVERVQQRVAGTVGGGTGALHRLLAEVGRMAAERTLVDGAVGVAVERHAEMLELVHGIGRLAAHELDGILVAQPVRPLTVSYICQYQLSSLMFAQRRAHAALRGDRVRTGREHFGQHRNRQARLGQLQRTAHAGSAGADHHHIKLAARQGIHDSDNGLDSPEDLREVDDRTDQPEDGQHLAAGARLPGGHSPSRCRARRSRHARPAQRKRARPGSGPPEGREHVEGEQRLPVFIRESRHDQQADDQHQGIHGQDDGGDALGDEIGNPVVGANDQALGAIVFVSAITGLRNSLRPNTRVSARLTPNATPALFLRRTCPDRYAGPAPGSGCRRRSDADSPRSGPAAPA